MAAVTAAVVVAAGTAYAANRSASSARNAQRGADRAAATQAEIDRERLDFSREQYDDWQERFNPVWDQLSSMAMQEQTPDYAAISADVGGAFDTSREINTRNMQRMGVKPTDGAQSAADTAYGIGRATSLVDTRNRARTMARDQHFDRVAQLANIANGGQANATNLMNAAYAGASGGAGQRAGMYNQNAMYYNNQANQQWGDVAGAIGYGVNMYGQGRGGSGGGNMGSWGQGTGGGSWGMTNWGGG